MKNLFDVSSVYLCLLNLNSYIATEISTDTLEVLALKGVEGRKNTEPESAKPAVGTHKDVLHQITRAVAYLHDKKIIHGNINPQSIVICSQEPTLNDLKPSPRAKLANFEVEGYAFLKIIIIFFSLVFHFPS